MEPATLARNFTPSSTALESESATFVGVAVPGQMVQGQTAPAPPVPVVKVHVTSAASGVPAVSVTPVGPPVTVAV